MDAQLSNTGCGTHLQVVTQCFTSTPEVFGNKMWPVNDTPLNRYRNPGCYYNKQTHTYENSHAFMTTCRVL